MKLYSEISSVERYERLNKLILSMECVSPDEVELKINCMPILWYACEECYRELMVSYYPMLPLLEMPQVHLKYADYIIYMHPYARCEDASEIVLRDLRKIAKSRKEGAEIIVVGKAANAEKLLNGSIDNITFYGDHFTEKLGKRFGIDMREEYFVYDEDQKHLAIWPVDGCLQHCKFCRRSYMHIKFESLSLEAIRENLDSIREEHPEWLKTISLRAENLTEYGIDIYGRPMLHALLDLLNSYEEIESIKFPIGLAIGEITQEILEALCRFKKIEYIVLNLEAGSDRLLKVIGKNHTCKQAINVYQAIRKAHPNAFFSSTVMIGLPTEEIMDMYHLADLIGKTQVDSILCNYYIYAPRQPLAKLPQISESLREYHLKIFMEALQELAKQEIRVECWKIPKDRKSRSYIRENKELEEENRHLSFPKHFIRKFRFEKVSD